MKQLLFILFISICTSVSAQDIASLIKEGDRQENLINEKAAFEKFKEVLKLQPANTYALNKCSELCSRIGKRELLAGQQNDYYEAAKTYAGITLRINPNNAEGNCVMAIALGRSSMNKSGKEKVAAAKEIRKYIDAAIKNDPNNYKAWHVLGRWHYEISSLNMFERAAVKILFGSMPPSSLSESIKAFERAHTLAAAFVLNNFEMARAYKKDGQKARAIQLLNAMMLLPNSTEDDVIIKNDGKKLLKEWQ